MYATPLLLCFMFLGVKKVCALLEDPFGWTFFDIPFENMSLQLHNELHNAAVVGSKGLTSVESFIPLDLRENKSSEKNRKRTRQKKI